MGIGSGIGYCKFFRRLISANQPHEIQELIEKYTKDIERTEAGFLDVVLNSGGAVSYQDVMTMPLPAIQLLIHRINHMREEQAKAANSR